MNMSHMLSVGENKAVLLLLCAVDYLKFKASDRAYCCCLIAGCVFFRKSYQPGGKLNEHFGL